MTWDPAQYERFREERSQPFFDLLALVEPKEGGAMRAVDLGCGTGELTTLLHQRLRCASTVGYDNSPEMLEAARARPPVDGLRFELADIGQVTFAPKSLDLVFANASLHWLPDHAALFARLVDALVDGGQLAVQMPANHDYPTHVLAREMARSPAYATALGGYVPPSYVEDLTTYAFVLHTVGLRPTRARTELYTHLLQSRDEVLEWTRGTLLTGVRSRLDAAAYEEFLKEYRSRLLSLLPDDRPFFYPFQRVLLWGKRPKGP